MFIYKVRNIVNNKVYIGQTVGKVRSRWYYHCRDAKSIKDTSTIYFARAILKYGINGFEVEEVCSADSVEELNFLEILFIEVLKATDHSFGYNCREGGYSGKHSEETKRLLSDIRKLDTKRNKKLGLAQANLTWINDGVISERWNKFDAVPVGWFLGRLKWMGTRWITNGSSQRRITEKDLIPEGWEVGRLSYRKVRPSRSKGKYKYKWVTDGTYNKRVKLLDPIPQNWKLGYSTRSRVVA